MILDLLIIPLFLNGIALMMEEGMLLHWWWKLIDRLPWWLNKPMGHCIYCMASFWGAPAYIALNWHFWHDATLIRMPIVLVCCVPIAGLIHEIVNKARTW